MPVVPLAIFEVVEVGGLPVPAMSWQAIPTKAPVKFGVRGGGLVGQDTGVELLRQPLPVAAVRRDTRSTGARNPPRRAAPPARRRNRRSARVKASDCTWSGRPTSRARACRQPRHARRTGSGTWAVVVADQPGHLLEVLAARTPRRRGAEAVRLLPPRDQRLAEQAADRLAAVQAQVAGPRGQAEQLVGQASAATESRSAARASKSSRRRRGGNGCGGSAGAATSIVRQARRRPPCAASRRRPRPSAGSPSRGPACTARDCAADGRTGRPCRSRRPASRRDRRGRRAAARRPAVARASECRCPDAARRARSASASAPS